MDREYYQYQKIPDKAMFYYFISKNDKDREITKVVAFQQMNILVYNMALVDYDEEKDIYSDDNVSNNFDISKIFATIFRIIRDFIAENPLFSVYISGNSDLKQQLYHRILKNNLMSLQNDYVILGVVDEMQVEIFDTTNNYIGFIIQKKTFKTMENIEKNKIKKMMDSIENNPILEQKLAQSKKIYDKIATKIDVLLKKR